MDGKVNPQMVEKPFKIEMDQLKLKTPFKLLVVG